MKQPTSDIYAIHAPSGRLWPSSVASSIYVQALLGFANWGLTSIRTILMSMSSISQQNPKCLINELSRGIQQYDKHPELVAPVAAWTSSCHDVQLLLGPQYNKWRKLTIRSTAVSAASAVRYRKTHRILSRRICQPNPKNLKTLPTEPITWMLLGGLPLEGPLHQVAPWPRKTNHGTPGTTGRLRHALRGGGRTRLLLGPGHLRHLSMDWFVGKILTGNHFGNHGFLPSNWSGVPVKFPIIQFYDSHLQEIQEDPVQDPWVDAGTFDHRFSVARNVWALGRWRYNGRSLLRGCSSSFNRKFLGWDPIRSQHCYTYYHVYIYNI